MTMAARFVWGECRLWNGQGISTVRLGPGGLVPPKPRRGKTQAARDWNTSRRAGAKRAVFETAIDLGIQIRLVYFVRYYVSRGCLQTARKTSIA